MSFFWLQTGKFYRRVSTCSVLLLDFSARRPDRRPALCRPESLFYRRVFTCSVLLLDFSARRPALRPAIWGPEMVTKGCITNGFLGIFVILGPNLGAVCHPGAAGSFCSWTFWHAARTVGRWEVFFYRRIFLVSVFILDLRDFGISAPEAGKSFL